MITRVMMRPRPVRRRVEEAAQVLPVSEEFKRCSGCVARKMCDQQQKCLHGAKAKPKGKKNGTNRRNG